MVWDVLIQIFIAAKRSLRYQALDLFEHLPSTQAFLVYI